MDLEMAQDVLDESDIDQQSISDNEDGHHQQIIPPLNPNRAPSASVQRESFNEVSPEEFLSVFLQEKGAVLHPRCINMHAATDSTNRSIGAPISSLLSMLAVFKSCIQLEEEYCTRLQELYRYLQDCIVVTSSSVCAFVSSAPFAGFSVAVDSAIVLSKQIVQGLKSISLDVSSFVSDQDRALQRIVHIHTTICTLFHKLVPLMSVHRHIIRFYDPLRELCNRLSTEFPEFSIHVDMRNLLHLSELAVRGLPSYVATCADAHRYVLLGLQEADFEYQEVLCSMEVSSEKLLGACTTCLLDCFNEVMEHRNLQKLHSLYQRFLNSGTRPRTDIEALVRRGRSVVREGRLRRHFQCRGRIESGASSSTSSAGSGGGVGECVVHVCSDLLLCSTFVDMGLRLQCCISLGKGTGTLCLPLPSMLSSTESSWFIIISRRKVLYLCASSIAERDAWVSDICQILRENTADNDIYCISTRAALVNTMLGEMQNLKESSGVDVRKEVSDSSRWLAIKRRNVMLIQPRWWLMCDVLEDMARNSHLPSTGKGSQGAVHLRQVMELHAEELCENILAQCATDKCRGAVATALSGKAGDRPHLIAVGFFFERSSGEAIQGISRPRIVEVFLLSTVLLAMYVSPSHVEEHTHELAYGFHIELSALECSHYQWDSECAKRPVTAPNTTAALRLVDNNASVVVPKRLSNLLSIGQQRSRVIYAPSIRHKMDWMELITEAISSCKESGDGSTIHKLRDSPLFRVCAHQDLYGPWVTEDPRDRKPPRKSLSKKQSSLT